MIVLQVLMNLLNVNNSGWSLYDFLKNCILQQQITFSSGRFIIGEIRIFTQAHNRPSTVEKSTGTLPLKFGLER